ncbi:MAG: hypothetical protein K2I60_01295 [Oscillospiraceae bacterium]|nr:hypothetical protein [Oscillospiraceae bacterium]
MADFSEMLQNILQTEEGKQGFAQAMSMLGGDSEKKTKDNDEFINSNNNSTDADSFPIDPSMLLNIQKIFSKMQKQDKNTEFIKALKPLLKPERQAKADEAIKMMKMFSMIPVLQKSGVLNQLFSG